MGLFAFNFANFLTIIWTAFGSFALHKLDFHYSDWETNYGWFLSRDASR